MTATPAITMSKPPLLWTGNVATDDDGARYGIAEVAQYVSVDAPAAGTSSWYGARTAPHCAAPLAPP